MQFTCTGMGKTRLRVRTGLQPAESGPQGKIDHMSLRHIYLRCVRRCARGLPESCELKDERKVRAGWGERNSCPKRSRGCLAPKLWRESSSKPAPDVSLLPRRRNQP